MKPFFTIIAAVAITALTSCTQIKQAVNEQVGQFSQADMQDITFTGIKASVNRAREIKAARDAEKAAEQPVPVETSSK